MGSKGLSRDSYKIDVKGTRVNLQIIRKLRLRKYEMYLQSLLSRSIKIWEMMTTEVQKATSSVNFKRFLQMLML